MGILARRQLDKVLDKCLFSGSYHPLALQAVSQHLKRVCKLEGWGKIADHLSLISEEIRNKKLQKVEDLIVLNYDNLQPKHKKHMFLDIVLLVTARNLFNEFELPDAKSPYAKACQVLGFLYKKYYSKSDIINLIYEFASDGLIQLENIAENEIDIVVHDLYSDLALREAASSSRFFTDGPTRSLEEIEWESLERVILRPRLGDDSRHCFVHKLQQQQQCQKLQVLYAPCIHFCSGIHLDFMKSLRLLKLRDESLSTSRIRLFNGITGVLNLNALVNLHILSISECQSVKRIEGLHALRQLKTLFVYKCLFLKNLDGLSGLLQLEFIRIEKVGLTCLEWLKLDGNEAMEEVGGLSPALKSVEVWHCGALKKMPDLSGLTCLERLELDGNVSMEEVGGLSPALKSVKVCHCGALKKMPDLSGLTRLERLELVCNEAMEEVGGLSPALKSVEVRFCGAVKKMADLSGLTCLQRLELAHNKSLEEVGGLSPALKSVEVRHCGALKKMPDLSGLTCLERLELVGNKLMEEVGGLSPALKCVVIQY